MDLEDAITVLLDLLDTRSVQGNAREERQIRKQTLRVRAFLPQPTITIDEMRERYGDAPVAWIEPL